MARGYSKTMVVGHVGGDPDVRFTSEGKAIAAFSVAETEVWKDKGSGERKERTEWHRVKLFGRLAEIAKEYVKKGSLVLVEGRHRTERYTDKEGVERYSTEVIGDVMRLLDRAPSPSAGASGQQAAPPDDDDDFPQF